MFFLQLNILFFVIKLTIAWKYQTKCTRHLSSSSSSLLNNDLMHLQSNNQYNSILEDFERDLLVEQTNEKIFQTNSQNSESKFMHLKCPNLNDFLFIGLTQYGVSKSEFNSQDNCKVSQEDCLVTVDYLANQCNGLNSCDIQLDSQFLHLCKNHSDYLTIAYECIPGSQRIDICSNDETFIIDTSLASTKQSDLTLSRFGSFYLTSPNYPNEYSSNLNNCTCKLEYVRLDTNSKESGLKNQEQNMHLTLKAYEFDLEEADEAKQCIKDKFRIDSDKASNTLCGQQKDFKEFYSTGSRFSFSLATDDVITRRGFLLKIATSFESTCPYGSQKFNSNKCIKFFGDDLETNTFKLNWFEASKSCQSLNGSLMNVNDFVDDSKFNSFIRSRSDDAGKQLTYWSLNKKNETNKCLLKKVNTWQEEYCLSKQAYICEFDAIKSENREKIKTEMSDNNGNRLIRVACGSAATLFSSSFKSAEVTTKTTTKQAYKSNSITNTQKPTRLYSKILPIISQKPTLNILDYDDEPIAKETTKTSPSSKNSSKSIFSQDLALIIAVACGVSIVLIAVNIFCIWNYYNKKLNNFRNDIIDQTYRSSTLRTKTASSSSTSSATNRTLTSTVDSYIKVPGYDLNQIEPHSACDSLSTTSATETSANRDDIMRTFFKSQINKTNNEHFYETLSRQQQQQQQFYNNYAEYNPIHRLKQFDSIVLMPTACNGIQSPHYISAKPMSINSTVVLLSSAPVQRIDEEQQYSSVVYGDLSPTSSASSTSSQPLITFASNSSGVSVI